MPSGPELRRSERGDALTAAELNEIKARTVRGALGDGRFIASELRNGIVQTRWIGPPMASGLTVSRFMITNVAVSNDWFLATNSQTGQTNVTIAKPTELRRVKIWPPYEVNDIIYAINFSNNSVSGADYLDLNIDGRTIPSTTLMAVMAEYDRHLACKLVTLLSAGVYGLGADVNVAKPIALRSTTGARVYQEPTWNYPYFWVRQRWPTPNLIQAIYPPYGAWGGWIGGGPISLPTILAEFPKVATGVWVDVNEVDWIDLNVDARRWETVETIYPSGIPAWGTAQMWT